MIQLELEFRLAYDVLEGCGADFLFNVQPARTVHQRVRAEELVIDPPCEAQAAVDPESATRLMRLHAQQGSLQLRYRAIVDIDHYHQAARLPEVPVSLLPLDTVRYLYPSRYCQSDRLLKFAAEEFGKTPTGYSRVLAVRDWVQRHVTYARKSSDSSTSALETLVSRVGVCRDFTHLMVALCRALNMPARMVTGTDYGASLSRGAGPDFHAYAEVYLGDRWFLFDASGIGIPMGFIRMATGRDAADVAFATIFGAVKVQAPTVRVRAREGPGLSRPHPTQDAISTSQPSESAWRRWSCAAQIEGHLGHEASDPLISSSRSPLSPDLSAGGT